MSPTFFTILCSQHDLPVALQGMRSLLAQPSARSDAPCVQGVLQAARPLTALSTLVFAQQTLALIRSLRSGLPAGHRKSAKLPVLQVRDSIAINCHELKCLATLCAHDGQPAELQERHDAVYEIVHDKAQLKSLM